MTGLDPHAVRYSTRFRNVGTGYPRMVALAYDRDTARAVADDPDTVAATVAEYERAHGLEPRDWPAIGRDEGHPGIDPGPP